MIEFWLQDGKRGDALRKIESEANQLGITVQSVPRSRLEDMAEGGRHQGVVLRCHKQTAMSEDKLLELLKEKSSPLLLILDGVEDPHNLGACLRTADAAGADAIVVPLHRGVGITPTVAKVACGAAENIPLVPVHNLVRFLEHLKQAGFWLIGTSGDAGQSIYDMDMKGSIAIILGAEGKGIRRLTAEHCDFLVQIPMFGVVESLNVSASAAICLYEVVRQRR